MGLRWAQKNMTPISVDLGADSLKLLQVATEDTPRLVAAAERDVPGDARKNADAYFMFVTHALREMVREAGIKTRRVVASISAAQTYVQHVRLASADPSMLEQQIEMELRGRLPLDPSHMVVRHVEVGQVFADGSAKHEVICLAAGRESVMRSVKALKAAGLDVVGMHCEPMAILAAFGHLFRRAGDEKRTTFFIDLGSATTKAIIAHGKQMVFAKSIHVAGEHFTRQMAQAWGVDLTEARHRRIRQAMELAAARRAAKQAAEEEALNPPIREERPAAAEERRHGASPPGMAALDAAIAAQEKAAAGPREQAGAATATQAATAPAEARVDSGDGGAQGEMLEALIDELQLCAGYHASMFADRPIEKVVFLGGEARHVGTCERIARALRLPAQLADPMARFVKPRTMSAVGVDPRQPQPGWAVPVGLCMLPTSL